MVTAPLGIYPPQAQQDHLFFTSLYQWLAGFPGDSAIKNPPANTGGTGSMPGSGRSPGGGHGYPLQSSCLENPMEREAWRATGSQRVRHDSVYTVMAGTPSVRKICREDRRKPAQRPTASPVRMTLQERPSTATTPGAPTTTVLKTPPFSPVPHSGLSPSWLTPCQWLTASHGLLGKGVRLLSFKRDGSQNKLLFYAHCWPFGQALNCKDTTSLRI